MFITKKNIISIVILSVFIIFGILFGIFYVKKSRIIADNKVIHLVFTTDKKYADYTKVAVLSAIKSKNPDTIYDINILSVELDEYDKKQFESLAENNASVKIIPLSLDSISQIGNYAVYNHVSRADLFKFFMPELFKDYDKILYIDSDTLILKDLSGIYNTDIKRYPLAAVKRFDPYYDRHFLFGYSFSISFAHYSYNCGVLLFNLDYWRKHDITEKLIKAKQNDNKKALMTQTAFNEVIPINKIKLLSPIYNAYSSSRFKALYFETYKFRKIYYPYMKNIYSFQDLYKEAVIIHYAGSVKPWNNDRISFSDKWWEYAKIINPDLKITEIKEP